MIYPVKVEAKEVRNRIVECKVRDHVVRVDQPKAFGADDTAPTPPEMLAVALASCVVSTIQFIAMQRNVEVRDIRVSAEGSIDFSKAMGISDKERAGFGGLTVHIDFDSDMAREEKAEFMRHVFDCGASIDNIRNSTPVTYTMGA